jgi:hypothetical protein
VSNVTKTSRNRNEEIRRAWHLAADLSGSSWTQVFDKPQLAEPMKAPEVKLPAGVIDADLQQTDPKRQNRGNPFTEPGKQAPAAPRKPGPKPKAQGDERIPDFRQRLSNTLSNLNLNFTKSQTLFKQFQHVSRMYEDQVDLPAIYAFLSSLQVQCGELAIAYQEAQKYVIHCAKCIAQAGGANYSRIPSESPQEGFSEPPAPASSPAAINYEDLY